ncbi:MAG: NH(3)-dependent NAD(+) synthetase [Armatimonadota bacterium]|nr:MAG: NH(3)-dependent NAD(+) synthetase [Armatimonadota bacterium]
MEELRIEPADVASRLMAFIRQAVEDFRREGVVVGLSGGMDSAVVAALATRALGAERVLGLILPERDSAPESKQLARQLARSLGIRYRTVGLTLPLALLGVYWQVPLWLVPGRRLKAKAVLRYYQQFRETLPEGETPFSAVMLGTRSLSGPWLNQTVAYHRVKVRLRMTVLYYYAERLNLLVAGTANKTELAIGFCVKHGDVAADIAPLAHLYKTQVRALAEYLNIPEPIITRPPSPDLLPGLTDELAIGLDYTTLDRVLWRMEQGMGAEAIAGEIGLAPTQVRYIQTLTERATRLLAPPLIAC